MEISSHFNEVTVCLEEQGNINFSQHHRFLKSVPLETRLDSRIPLLLFRQLRFEGLQLQVRGVEVAREKGSRLVLPLKHDVINLAALMLAGIREVLMQST